MPSASELELCLRELHLSVAADCYGDSAQEARRENSTHEEFLLTLMRRELEQRRQNRTARWLHESRLPLEKNLESFDRTRLPARVATAVKTLLEGELLDRAENVLAFGNPGSGKTHLVCALALELIQHGRRILFCPCQLLVQDLLRAKRELALAQEFKRLARYEALIIDDIGYVQQDREEMEVLFALLADRYERRSLMITSNLPFSKWEAIFKDPMTTAAAIDRLIHHSTIVQLNLASYRLQAAKRARAGDSPAESRTAKGEDRKSKPKEVDR
jgi:DNA replication protein DnaC